MVKARESNAGAQHFTDSCLRQTEETKKESVDIPAEGPVTIPTPRAPRETTARPTPHMIGVRESATPAPGGGPGLIWVDTKTHVYHSRNRAGTARLRKANTCRKKKRKQMGIGRPELASEAQCEVRN